MGWISIVFVLLEFISGCTNACLCCCSPIASHDEKKMWALVFCVSRRTCGHLIYKKTQRKPTKMACAASCFLLVLVSFPLQLVWIILEKNLVALEFIKIYDETIIDNAWSRWNTFQEPSKEQDGETATGRWEMHIHCVCTCDRIYHQIFWLPYQEWEIYELLYAFLYVIVPCFLRQSG